MAKPKIYPSSIAGQELKFVQDNLLNEKKHLKAPALNALPPNLKEELATTAHSRGLLDTSNLSECVYWIVHQLSDYPKRCTSCDSKITKFHCFSRGYPHSRCSTKCSNSDKSVQAKKKVVSIEKYGTEFPWQSAEIKQKSRQAVVSDRFNKMAPEYLSVATIEKCAGCNTKFTWKHSCGHVFNSRTSNDIVEPMCPACREDLRITRPQRDIIDYVKTLYSGIIVTNDRRTIWPLELDIFLPDKKIAIEYNGLYWHSYDRTETFEEKNKHKHKADACDAVGIKLIQIWEHEWEEQREIVKSRLKSILGADERTFARKCSVRDVPTTEAGAFQKLIHIQGSVGASVKLGLYLGDKLVALMTFGKPRFSKKYEWELLRYCSAGTVVGGASRLMKHFIEKMKPSSIVTYADRRWSNGNMYAKLGFTSIDKSSPNYFYFRDATRYPRYAFQKHKLAGILEKFDADKSEHENAFANGYRRAWDAGNHVLSWTLDQPVG